MYDGNGTDGSDPETEAIRLDQFRAAQEFAAAARAEAERNGEYDRAEHERMSEERAAYEAAIARARLTREREKGRRVESERADFERRTAVEIARQTPETARPMPVRIEHVEAPNPGADWLAARRSELKAKIAELTATEMAIVRERAEAECELRELEMRAEPAPAPIHIESRLQPDSSFPVIEEPRIEVPRRPEPQAQAKADEETSLLELINPSSELPVEPPAIETAPSAQAIVETVPVAQSVAETAADRQPIAPSTLEPAPPIESSTPSVESQPSVAQAETTSETKPVKPLIEDETVVAIAQTIFGLFARRPPKK